MRRRARVAIAVLSLASWAGSAAGTTWVVGEHQPFTSIQAAITQAAAYDLVLIEPGFYYERLVLRDGVAVSAEVPGSVVVDAEAAGPVVSAIGVGSTTLVTGLVLRHGSAVAGGGLWAVAASPVFAGCTFEDNTAVLGGGAYLRDGSRAEFVECRFTGNQASVGGGLYLDFSAAHLSSCTIDGNAAGDGGALVAANAAEAILGYVSIYANVTSTGATVACSESSPRLTNCTIALNQSGTGAIVWRSSGARLERCIVAFNSGPAFGCAGSNAPWLGCNVIYGNGSDALCGGDQGTNLFVDPLFCDPISFYLGLAANSPAVGGTCGTIGAETVACPAQGIISAIQPASWSEVKGLYRP